MDVVRVLRDHVGWETSSKKDVYPLLEDPGVRSGLVDELCRRADTDCDRVAGIEATGMVFGSFVASALDAGFVAARRREKWPYQEEELVIGSCVDYSGSEKQFAVRKDQVRDGESLLLVDDWVETGSQLRCVRDVLERAGADVVDAAVLVVEEEDVADEVSSLAVLRH